MKIDRRCFLSFIVGGAAGTALSPLPWKITDDLSICSQNWPWTPVPPKGETSFVTSTCTLCPGGCGISVRKVDERAVKVEGLKGHPVNDGGLGILGLAAAQLLYSPTRVHGPLKKVDGAWRDWGLRGWCLPPPTRRMLSRRGVCTPFATPCRAPGILWGLCSARQAACSGIATTWHRELSIMI